MNSLKTINNVQVDNENKIRETKYNLETCECPVLVVGLKCGEVYYGTGKELTFVCVLCGEHFEEITAYRSHSCFVDGGYEEELARTSENNIQIQFDPKGQSQSIELSVAAHSSESNNATGSILEDENQKKEINYNNNFEASSPDSFIQSVDLAGLIPKINPMELSSTNRIHCRKGFPWKHVNQKITDINVEQKKRAALLPNPFHESHCRQKHIKMTKNQKPLSTNSKQKEKNIVGLMCVESKEYPETVTEKETQLTSNCKNKHANSSGAHKDTKSKPFRCERCNKHFSSEGHLRFHMNKENRCILQSEQEICKPHNRNSNAKPPAKCALTKISVKQLIKCEICQEDFRFRVDLERHLLTHGIDRPYKCDICLKMFKLRSSLCLHRKRHKNDEN